MNKKINVLCYSLMLFLGIHLAIYQNSMNYITEGIKNKNMVMGLLVALRFIGIMIAPIMSGEIGDRIGKKKVLLVSLVIITLGISMIILSRSIFLIALGIFLTGCGSGSIESLGSSILADTNPLETNKVINISQVFFSVGAVLGPLLSLKIIDLLGNWKLSYFPAFLAFAVMIAVTYAIRFVNANVVDKEVAGAKIDPNNDSSRETSKQEEEEVSNQDKGLFAARLFKDGYLRLLCLSIFLYVGIESGSAFWITTYFSDVLKAGKLGSYALSGFWGGMIIGRYICSKLESKKNMAFNASLVISALSIIICLSLRTPISGVINFTVLGFGFAAIWPALMASAAERHPQNTGTAIGMMMTASAIGGVIIPFIMGVLGNTFSVIGALTVVPITSLLILVTHNIAEKKIG
ncbi:MAG TPA: MFS transporter [Clostridiaceae bacterium]|nr:MFS transporter [Clostridiaceae bacterium]